jgi:ribonuclease P protein component
VLAKPNRLQKAKDIKKVLEKGKRVKEGFLVLKTLPNKSGESRFAFIVSQKFSKKAVLRNKIKRKLRELVRAKESKIKKGEDAIIIALPGLETKDFWEIEEMLDKLFEKAKIKL